MDNFIWHQSLKYGSVGGSHTFETYVLENVHFSGLCIKHWPIYPCHDSSWLISHRVAVGGCLMHVGYQMTNSWVVEEVMDNVQFSGICDLDTILLVWLAHDRTQPLTNHCEVPPN